MFEKVLVANRGEIAVRIIRTLKELGIKSVAIYSKADSECLHTYLADEAICIGPANVKDSYLNKLQIINAALTTGSDAIHPGFGFLSENYSFASLCEKYGITFIGPKSDTILACGDKAKAREVMKKAGVPIIPGSDGELDDIEDCYLWAEKLGYPVLLKASSGGGGKGMRFVYKKEDMIHAYESATMEALNAFGNGGLYMEKAIINPRHIEVQIIGDTYGNYIHLGERDCSLQRRNQKVIEEAPAYALDENTRKKICKAAVKAAKHIGYVNAGTIEFLYTSDGQFYFMEMNTRIQVEHPVTEMITGVDIVKEQVFIAAKEKLSITAKDIEFRGHAIEVRLNACNPEKDFMPSCGEIKECILPGGFGIRVDTYIYPSYVITPFYDSMLCKIISYGNTREEAIRRMQRALSECVIQGIETNISYLTSIINSLPYQNGNVYTSFLEDNNFVIDRRGEDLS